MVKKDDKKAQAAIELAVFGAILIFVLGTIVRSAIGNSYQQNQSLKAMRMALLLSSRGSPSDRNGNPTNSISRNSASIIFLEDRLSVDVGKYGSLERSPQQVQGSGSFTYQMFYPLDQTEPATNAPIMDVYINGQHFPFTTAQYMTANFYPPGTPNVTQQTCSPPDTTTGGKPYALTSTAPLTQLQCAYNQCLRNQREWVMPCTGTCAGGVCSGTGQCGVSAPYKLFYSQVANGTPEFSVTAPTCNSGPCKDLALSANLSLQGTSAPAYITTNQNADMQFDLQRNGDYAAVDAQFPPCTVCPGTSSSNTGNTNNTGTPDTCKCTMSGGGTSGTSCQLLNAGTSCAGGCAWTGSPTQNGTPPGTFTLTGPGSCATVGTSAALACITTTYTCPEACKSTCACKKGLGNTCTGNDSGGQTCSCPTGDTPTGSCNPSCPDGAGYTCPTPTAQLAANCLRANMAWEWSATAGINTTTIGLDADTQTYPSYDIDGRLSPVTIYSISGIQYPSSSSGPPNNGSTNGPPYGSSNNGVTSSPSYISGAVSVGYLDPQQGDIDSSWDTNSCGPKPGLQPQLQIYTFTKNGTYLQIKEGKLYNPETDQVVRSVNQRDNVDLIQRQIQLSKNTGRFCPNGAGIIPPGSAISGSSDPNPVEICVNGGPTAADTCFCSMSSSPSCSSGVDNIKLTCFDLGAKMIFVRSRLEDRRGRFWITDTNGQLGVQ